MWADRYIERLKNGEPVQFRPRGKSMEPLINSGDLVQLFPTKLRPLKVGKVVLCKVAGAQYLHLVTAIDGDRVQISNNKGHVNGWTSIKNVYGVVFGVGPL